jgi:hypothetical protein
MDYQQRRRTELDSGTHRTRQAGVRNFLTDVRRRRHAGFLETAHRLDVGLDATACAALAKWAREEYEREIGDIPIGLVATCHLGPPYVDHRLDLFQSILEHYAPLDVMPEPYAGARMLVRSGAYEFVEVWASGELRPVRADGSTVG